MKLDYNKLLEIKNEFYSTFKGNEWFRGAGLYRTNKIDWSIMTYIRSDSLDKVPDMWRGIEVKKSEFV